MALSAFGSWEVVGDADWFKASLVDGHSYILSIMPRDNVPGISVAGGVGLVIDLANLNTFSNASAFFVLGSVSTGHFTAAGSGPVFFSAANLFGESGGQYVVTLTAVDDDYADNSSTTGAFAVSSPGTMIASGIHEVASDVDAFAVSLVAGQTYRLSSSNSSVYAVPGDEEGGIADVGFAGDVSYFKAASSGVQHVFAFNASDLIQEYTLALEEVNYIDDFSSNTSTSGVLSLLPSPANPGQVSGIVDGTHEIPLEHDWFRVTLEANRLYSFAASYDLPDEFKDLSVAVLDSAGDYIQYGGADYTSDGVTEGSFMTQTGGTFYIDLFTSDSFEDVAPGAYTLTVSSVTDDFTNNDQTAGTVAVDGSTSAVFNAAGDQDWFAVNLVAGESYRVFLTGNDLGEIEFDTYFINDVEPFDSTGFTTITAMTSATYYVAAQGEFSSQQFATVPYIINLAAYDDDFSDNSTTTGVITVNGSASGEIEVSDDRDWFQVSLAAGVSYSATVISETGAFLSSVYQSDGTPIAEDDTFFFSGSGAFTARTSGSYFIEVGGFDAGSTYTVAVDTYDDDYVDNESTTGLFFDTGAALQGTGDSDRLTNRSGNDLFQGGGGIDTAVYAFTRAEAVITRDGNGALRVDAGASGTDLLFNVERLDFSDGSYSFQFDASNAILIANFGVGAGGWSSQDLYPRHVGDVNGDGFADVVGFGFGGVLVSFGSAEGSFSTAAVMVSNFGQTAGWTSDDAFHRELADVNGDGRSDIVGFGFAGTLVSLGRADGTFADPLTGAANFGFSQGWTSQTGFARTMGDVDGDGNSDIIGFGAAGTLVALGNGDGTFGTAALRVADFGVAQGWSNDTSFHRTVADVDGDGNADIVGFGAAGTLVALSNGDGTFETARLVLDNFGAAQGWSSQDAFARAVADVNGDGMADIVGFGAGGTFVAYGLEDGTFSAASFDVENFGQAQGWTSDTSFHRTLADIDNDGLNDVVGFGFAGVLAGFNQGDVVLM